MEISSFSDKQQVIDKLAELAAEVNRTAVIVESSPTLSQRVGMSMQGAEEGEAQYAERVSSIDNFNAASKYNALWQRAVDNKYITILDGTPRVEQHTNTHSGLRGGFWLAPPFKTQLEPVGEPVRFFPTTPVPIPLPVNPVTNEPLILLWTAPGARKNHGLLKFLLTLPSFQMLLLKPVLIKLLTQREERL